jgi:hypothetical protein
MLELELAAEPRYESIAGVYGLERLDVRYRPAA